MTETRLPSGLWVAQADDAPPPVPQPQTRLPRVAVRPPGAGAVFPSFFGFPVHTPYVRADSKGRAL